MTNRSDIAFELSPTDEIRFVEHHRPNLKAGDYDFKVEQQVTLEEPEPGPLTPPPQYVWPPFEKTANISVRGDRFELAPEAVHAVFPPAGSRGNYWHHFPHVILNRSTLPWERSACDDFEKDKRPPWLALLLFDQEEMAGIKRSIVDLESLKSATESPSWPETHEERGQHDSDQVVVIDVPWNILKPLLPQNCADFGYRTHSRRVVPPELRVSVHQYKRKVDCLIEKLNQKWTRGALADFFAAERIMLGDPNGVEWSDGKEGGPWRFSDPSAGTYEFVHGGEKGALEWLMVTSGPVPETGAVDPTAQHRFVAVDGNLHAWVTELDTDDKDILPAGLSALLKECGIKLGDGPKVSTEKKGECWRVVDKTSTVHHMIRVAPKAGHLEVLGYGDPSAELAVVLGNRLPAPGQRCVAHLVSLEKRYTKSGDDCVFHEKDVSDSEKVRLVSLKSWDFFCLDGKRTFKGLLEDLNRGDGKEVSPGFHLPFSEKAKGEEATIRLRAGFVPLKHKMRRGDRSVSWYHGPLVPRALKGEIAATLLPATAADKLVLFDQDTGLFDVSYAAAWEVGRMVTLANTRLALRLFNWKRSHAHDLLSARHLADFGFHLPVRHEPMPDAAMTKQQGLPPDLESWFHDLTLLRHVPFNYLVPDERLLPPESLRFFTLDPQWLKCLRDGAFSIGRVLPAEVGRDKDHREDKNKMPPPKPVSGFLLRSEVVLGYPGLLFDAYGVPVPQEGEPGAEARDDSHLDAADYPTLTCLRRDQLSPNVLLCLFEGDVRMVDFHLQPETLHLGLDLPDETVIERKPEVLIKKLRRDDGEQVEQFIESAASGSDDAVQVDGNRVVDFVALADDIKSQLQLGGKLPTSHLAEGGQETVNGKLNPAVFALEMVAGVDLVRFVRRDDAAAAAEKGAKS